ncbi:hypothetical protein AK88_04941 [Plasmodium fragile]|uniref:Schizont-infected cell agglutination C-terminal domain-containing protein n=1 Tax=Plasmodium fragile TaxID=5857 RepID=A0A0D9QEK4_PLAFR|nr:uncharacterized protein AK88_04941 [Plasmodium fragile]KJP85438.1 hypothetical protein AK88_04941 [Plasmodium fragile]
MWEYLILLWDRFIEKGNTGVKEQDIVQYKEYFWENVKTVWQKFKDYMKQKENAGDMKVMCDALIDPDASGGGSQTDRDMCELTLIALHFKHEIHEAVANKTSGHIDNEINAQKTIMLYMRCILVNIFMKKIIGRNCLQRTGGQQAFGAADGIFKNMAGKEVGNIECERKDAGEGGIKGVREEHRTFWQIMDRWFDRTKMLLRDGDWGVLGESCMVEKKKTNGGRDEQLGDLKENVKKQMEEVGDDIAQKIERILPKVKTCTSKECVKSAIEQEKQKDSLSTAPKGKGDGQSGPPPGKPAPAKPAAAKPPGSDGHAVSAQPVAAQTPVAPPSRGTSSSGAMASSGGGGKGGGGGKAAGGVSKGTGKTVKAGKGQECDGDLARRDQPSTVYVVPPRDDNEWNKWKQVLQEFTEHMEEKNDLNDAYGENCHNSGWDDIKDDGTLFMGQTVADVLRCKVMSVAWGFANGWGQKTDTWAGKSEAQRTDIDMLRCEVANIFGHILQAMYCPRQTTWKRGIEYSRIAFRKMQSTGKNGAGVVAGPVIDGRCTACGYGENRRWAHAINLKVVEWLMQDAGILGEIKAMEKQWPCNTQWKDYIKQLDPGSSYIEEGNTPGGNLKDRLSDVGKEKIQEAQKQMKGTVTKIIKKVQDATEEITKAAKEGYEEEHKKAQKEIADATEKTSKDKDSPARPPALEGTEAGTSGPPQAAETKSPKAAGSNDKDPGGTQPQAPASPVLPARPPPPPPPKGKASEGTQGGNDADKAGKCTESSTSTITHGSSVSVSLGCTPDSALGVPPSTLLSPTDPAPGDAVVVDGGNDDPPPLNPPKPKPNPNPNQSGSSGSFSDADLANGVSGGNGQAGAAGGAPGRAGAGGSSGGGGRGGERGSGTEVGTPSVPPGLTWEDVKPYTPAMIPAVVGIGVVAFFLWKYFAYVAKRRRTYRTVRDIPSPPLDEEILDHLQRGALRPPDYGYTMVRDTRPASAAERRRRRHPRVHKRTIIELHLELLNECEAAAWENVKDDYLQILVEEFMAGNNGHSSCPDAPSTNQDLSGNNVSSTVDPSTESDGTDPCPPHAHDPWSCMETIQLEEEQSPAPTVPGAAKSYCTQWITWIDRNKHLLRACTTKPWFLQLTLAWKRYLRDHMAANEASGEHRTAATVPMQKLRLWKQWVSQQHRHMRMYSEQEWFQHLLNTVQEATVSEKGEVPRVETHLEVEQVTAAANMLRVRDIPRTQPLHEQYYKQKHLIAKLWLLLLSSVIEDCALERNLQDRELYVDALLRNMLH